MGILRKSRFQGPILVTGSYRSGTTWVSRILSHPPERRYVDAPFFLEHQDCPCGIKFKYAFEYIRPSSPAAEKYRTHLGHILYPDGPSVRGRAGPLLAGAAMELYSRWLRKSQPIVHDPFALLSAPWLAKAFGMRVVILIRHPAAFAGSLKRMGWGFDFKHILKQKILTQNCLEPFLPEIESHVNKSRDLIDQACLLWRILYSVVRQYREEHSWIFVRHEDISLDPIRHFESIHAGLSLEFNDSARRKAAQFSSPRNRNIIHGSRDNLTRNSRTNIWTWKKRLSPHEIARIRRQVQDVSPLFYSDQDW